MGPGIVLFFWLLIAAVFAAVWAVAVVLFAIARRKKWRVMKWVSAVPMIAIPVFGLIVGGFLVFGILRSMNPGSVFKDTFHQSPDGKVRGIKSQVFWFA